jgi:hypothetical protein
VPAEVLTAVHRHRAAWPLHPSPATRSAARVGGFVRWLESSGCQGRP